MHLATAAALDELIGCEDDDEVWGEELLEAGVELGVAELVAIELGVALAAEEGVDGLLPPPLPPQAVNSNPMLIKTSKRGSLAKGFIGSPGFYDYL